MIKITTIFTPKEKQTFETVAEFEAFTADFQDQHGDFQSHLVAAGVDVTDDSVYQEAVVTEDDNTSLKITIAYADQEQIDTVVESLANYVAGLDIPVEPGVPSEDHLF